ncbi:MAG: hypothetical protein EXS36_10900 [Pedosphaera sp.]|nr:hypothetical protein [Pedosphaera sp.]
MSPALHVNEILPGIFSWSAYSAEHRCELTSQAVRNDLDFLLFDPLPVSAEILDGFRPIPPSAVVLTNDNHERAAVEWKERFKIPVYGPAGSRMQIRGLREVHSGSSPFSGWEVQSLAGGAPNELAWLLPERSLAVFGDAVVNLRDRQLELLPAKYCENSVCLRESIAHFIRRPFEHAVFAHGTPLLAAAAAKISKLIA